MDITAISTRLEASCTTTTNIIVTAFTGHDQPHETETLRKLQVMLDHWIEHDDIHVENYREWAARASQTGEEEIAKEIHLAISENESVKNHLKRAKAILAAKLVLRK
jgi:hypothetical protein